MLKRRLFLQIYFTIIASLVIVAVLSGLLWILFGRDHANREIFDICIAPGSLDTSLSHAAGLSDIAVCHA